MKRLLIAIGCLMVMAGPASAVVSFPDLVLFGADHNFQSWDTHGSGNRPTLGISTTPGGDLINNSNRQGLQSSLTPGVYYLYAGNLGDGWLGTNPFIQLHDQGGALYQANFTVTGTPGTFSLWTNGYNSPSDPIFYLGWAQGTADKASHTLGGFPSGDEVNDYYLVLGIGVEPTNPVPIPGAVWLLGSGIVGLIGLKRRGIKRNENGRA